MLPKQQGCSLPVPAVSFNNSGGMKHACQLLTICLVVVFASSLASHFAARWLDTGSTATNTYHLRFGPEAGSVRSLVVGSSLAFSGLDWDRIAETLGEGIEAWTIGGSSPSEWEILAGRSPCPPRIIAVVSPYDMNEHWLCDFRSELVPFGQTLRDLWQSRQDWAFRRRVLNQYPLTWLRTLFPTAGKSNRVLVGIRAKLRAWAKLEAEQGLRVGGDHNPASAERLTDWTAGRLQRRLALIRGACQDRHGFNGPKKLALLRLLRRADPQDRSLILVLPVSCILQQEFLSPDVLRDFEDALADVQRACPQADIVTLDHWPALQHNALFSDLVHLNQEGRQIATELCLGHIPASHR